MQKVSPEYLHELTSKARRDLIEEDLYNEVDRVFRHCMSAARRGSFHYSHELEKSLDEMVIEGVVNHFISLGYSVDRKPSPMGLGSGYLIISWM